MNPNKTKKEQEENDATNECINTEIEITGKMGNFRHFTNQFEFSEEIVNFKCFLNYFSEAKLK